ncbi:MAG: 30S ribosomal protein S17 [Chloroflexi bacterium]|nr:30S ribosomal protein S17 [Chloroflexota bacterium]MCH7982772.1 30S ribosomal protein S17 [Chloroflexota bacterium]MCH8114089.1 30S ribosomal protein S17 [Chloroflexota bacterium]MCI0774825.1 30S ribosomal protein S17 [Chloroflexota bacterium]MCI0803050.1 30S ribosomal protein S17 [Chloroflexota bacterium]
MARKRRTGTVLKDANEKSVVVGVSWSQRDRIYKKARRKLTKFVVHDEQNSATVGDRVLIEEARPLSRTKRWRLVEILEKVDIAEVQPSDIDTEAVLAGTQQSEASEESGN